jgi:hypothetical protein
MAEGLSAAEVGKEIAEHLKHTAQGEHDAGRDRRVTIVEAALLAIVALLAAWSGYASAKWSTESRVHLSAASAARVEANRAAGADAETLEFDSSTFEAWFTAYVAGNEEAMAIAARRFRPEFRVAFDAWQATDPATNPDAPPGPTYMPEYERPGRAEAERLDAHADERFADGVEAGEVADQYVRITVYLATVLFLVGISGHFRVPVARYGLVGLSVCILVFALVLLITTPSPPG